MIISLYKTIFVSREDPLLFIPMNDLDLLLWTALESFDFDQTALSNIFQSLCQAHVLSLWLRSTNRLSIPKQKQMFLTSYGSSTTMKLKWIDSTTDHQITLLPWLLSYSFLSAGSAFTKGQTSGINAYMNSSSGTSYFTWSGFGFGRRTTI